jgi:hypothetical protein
MKDEEQEGIEKDGAEITGRTEGPFGSDDTDIDRRAEDNKHRYEQENSANGLDSIQVRGGQDGRNIRGIGSTDMDSKEGLLRQGDTANSTMEVTEEGLKSAVADSPEDKSKKTEEERDEEIAETGTDLNNKPSY